MSNPSDNYQYSIDSSSLFDNDSSSQYATTNAGTEYASADQFSISNTEAQRLNTLVDAKQKKLDRLSQKNQNASLDDSFTELEDGRLESNRNKIWNDLSGQEYQDLFNYGVSNYALNRDEEGNLVYASGERYSGPTRRLYMFGTQADSDEQIKLGLARGDLEGSEARYQPDINTGYGWAPGGLGVDTSKKELDVLLPYNVATMLEGLAHGRKQALEGRVVKDRYEDPFLLKRMVVVLLSIIHLKMLYLARLLSMTKLKAKNYLVSIFKKCNSVFLIEA